MTTDQAQKKARYWAVVPAAGVGRRMQSSAQPVPKQYLKIRGHSILELTLTRLCQLGKLENIVLVLNQDDTWYQKLNISMGDKLMTTIGGDERAISVYKGLQALTDMAADDDWVLVHDVVRPCVSVDDMSMLVSVLANDATGGLLVMPVSETLKKIDANGLVESTVPRESYRLAGTPQMFRYKLLMGALEKALKDKQVITDEAHAMELAGYPVKLVAGGGDNIKITHPEDLVLAEFILNKQGAL